MGVYCRGVSFDFRCDASGIFQVKCEWSVGAQQFVTMFNRDFDDPNTRDEPPSVKLKKGDPDSFGVVQYQYQIKIRDAAKNDLGSMAYASSITVPIHGYFGSSGPGNHCNIFVAHKAYDAGANVPAFNGYIPPYDPPAANQWAGVPPDDAHPAYEQYFTPIPWTLLAEDAYPEPGLIAAEPQFSWISGHCGIVDYDGRWISASVLTNTVNRQASFELRGRDGNFRPLLCRMRLYPYD